MQRGGGSHTTVDGVGTEPLDHPEPLEQPEAPAGVSLVAYLGDQTCDAQLREGEPLVVGRSLPATFVLPDSKLSREHARFTLCDGHVDVRDLGSLNGTWLGAERVEQARLPMGAEVRVGATLLRVRGPEPVPLDPSSEPYLAGPLMSRLREDVARVANSQVPVVLQGETGCGKEVFAQLLHDIGPRRDKPLIRVNCAAIPAQLVEGTLFGHERGAYTGAHQRQRGLFEEADGGTIFLDEIGELTPPAQASMLRALESGTFSRVGSPTEVKVDVRVVVATHRSLKAMVSSGAFRADLYYRLNAVTLEIPPLRARRSDIEPIVRRLAARSAVANGRSLRGIAPAALRVLERQEWLGNVRELKNAIDHAVVLCRGDIVELRDLPTALRAQPPSRPASRPSSSRQPAVREVAAESPPTGPTSPEDLRPKIDEYEARLIVDALRRSGGSKTEAARLLGLPIRTLSRRIKLLGIGGGGEVEPA